MKNATAPLGTLVLLASFAAAQTPDRLIVRAHEQRLRLYGPASDDPVIVSSGDGGRLHLSPHIASEFDRRLTDAVAWITQNAPH